ncbi:hypothetical protein CAP35_14005 [Chitinophagaceae bacterium IBVUCB1]|nr:hypothetical protein CAP35_14005 [Chitinophagaceae bacterium IBVUCB1]
MKKQSLLLLAGGMLALASCQNEAAAPAAGPSEAQIDSMVNARVEEARMELMASNDSLINALAQWKADSMIAAMKGSKPAAPKPVVKKTVAPSGKSTAGNTGTATTTTSTNSKDDRFNGGNTSGKNKEARFSEDAAKQEQQKAADKKGERFK